MSGSNTSGHGTIKASGDFSAEGDASVLRIAMKGIGADNKEIIAVIGSRNNRQRQEIKEAFNKIYKRDLVADLKSELSWCLKDLVLALMMTPREFDAFCIKYTLADPGASESTLLEILFSRNNEEIKEINQIYRNIHGKLLSKHLQKSMMTGHFRNLISFLNNGSRNNGNKVDKRIAMEDAKHLHEIGVKKWETDENTFNFLLANRSDSQLRATFEAYRQIAKIDIIQAIQQTIVGEVKDGMMTLVELVCNPPGYFARRLYESMKGFGTDDKLLIRVLVMRSEIDMVEVKQAFMNQYHISLAEYTKDDTSGDYRRLLLALI